LFPATELQGESNGYASLGEDQPTGRPGGGSPRASDCDHSSDEDNVDDEEEEEEEEDDDDEEEEEEVEAGEEAIEADEQLGMEEAGVEGDVTALDGSGSRPLLLLDSEDEEDPEAGGFPAQLSAATAAHSDDQPLPTDVSSGDHTQPLPLSPRAAEAPDVFSKAPFQFAQDEVADVFANAPFPRAHIPAAAAEPQLDVFSQAPFGKRKEASGGAAAAAGGVTPQSKSPYARHGSPDPQGVLGQVAPQPFRPQALAKYSRHFEGPIVPQQPVVAHRVVSSVGRQAAVGSVPVGPLHSWTSEPATAMDPFVSAPFHLKAPQEKP